MRHYSTYMDQELVDLLKTGNEAAFTELYERYWKKLLVRAGQLLHSHEDAEEIVHDIFVRLWKKRETITILHSVHSYLAAMLQYDCYRLLAEQRRKRVINAFSATPEAADNSTQELLDFEALRGQLEEAVSTLPERCQLIFRLSREGGMTDKQVARKLHLSVHTVRTQMHRALTSLKTDLNNFFFF